MGIQPNLDEVQETLVQAGKNITSVAKGVGQWTGGRPQVNFSHIIYRIGLFKSKEPLPSNIVMHLRAVLIARIFRKV